MSLTKKFNSLASFGRFLETRKDAMIPVGKLIIGAAAQTLYRETRKYYGDHSLADLAPATRADRVAKGFSPNDPLLRDGSLLRDSVEMEVGVDYAAVGSSEPVAGYHEYGYVNARTGNSVPARPVFKRGLEETVPKIMRIAEDNIGRVLGFAMLADDAAPLLPGITDITAQRDAK